MSAATDIQALRNELAQLKATLEMYFESLPQQQFVAWRRAKRAVAEGVIETPGDVTVGKNLPQAPTRTISNGVGIGGSAL